MRALLILTAVTAIPFLAAAPAAADETYYCVQPVVISTGNGDVSTLPVCVYAPPSP